MSLMTEYPDRRVWRLGGHEVTQLLIDYRFAFQIWWRDDASADNEATVVIGMPFVLRSGHDVHEMDPEATASVAPALMILHKPVESLSAYRNGRLVVAFANDVEIVVEKQAQHESWEARGCGILSDLQLLCSPHHGPPWSE
jgi:uncharacterized protein DUF6188